MFSYNEENSILLRNTKFKRYFDIDIVTLEGLKSNFEALTSEEDETLTFYDHLLNYTGEQTGL